MNSSHSKSGLEIFEKVFPGKTHKKNAQSLQIEQTLKSSQSTKLLGYQQNIKGGVISPRKPLASKIDKIFQEKQKIDPRNIVNKQFAAKDKSIHQQVKSSTDLKRLIDTQKITSHGNSPHKKEATTKIVSPRGPNQGITDRRTSLEGMKSTKSPQKGFVNQMSIKPKQNQSSGKDAKGILDRKQSVPNNSQQQGHSNMPKRSNSEWALPKYVEEPGPQNVSPRGNAYKKTEVSEDRAPELRAKQKIDQLFSQVASLEKRYKDAARKASGKTTHPASSTSKQAEVQKVQPNKRLLSPRGQSYYQDTKQYKSPKSPPKISTSQAMKSPKGNVQKIGTQKQTMQKEHQISPRTGLGTSVPKNQQPGRQVILSHHSAQHSQWLLSKHKNSIGQASQRILSPSSSKKGGKSIIGQRIKENVKSAVDALDEENSFHEIFKIFEAAAIFIQKHFRGYQTRKFLRGYFEILCAAEAEAEREQQDIDEFLETREGQTERSNFDHFQECLHTSPVRSEDDAHPGQASNQRPEFTQSSGDSDKQGLFTSPDSKENAQSQTRLLPQKVAKFSFEGKTYADSKPLSPEDLRENPESEVKHDALDVEKRTRPFSEENYIEFKVEENSNRLFHNNSQQDDNAPINSANFHKDPHIDDSENKNATEMKNSITMTPEKKGGQIPTAQNEEKKAVDSTYTLDLSKVAKNNYNAENKPDFQQSNETSTRSANFKETSSSKSYFLSVPIILLGDQTNSKSAHDSKEFVTYCQQVKDNPKSNLIGSANTIGTYQIQRARVE